MAIVVSVTTIGNGTMLLGNKRHCSELSDGNFEVGIYVYSKEFLNAQFFLVIVPDQSNLMN